ncbi:MAG TPA: heavy metal translocating P-type ATPase, partial [Anaerolineales bacterium]|nr:heavy metal translocating P-type ATPase [Anaerolineales bacterium]
MKNSHTKEKHHDHSAMEHDQHIVAENKAPSEHSNHIEKKSSSHDMHAAPMDHAAHGMGKEDEHAGHVDHSGHEDTFRRRFWISLLLSIPVLLYTPMLQMWFGFRLPDFPGSQWVMPLFSVIVFVYGGMPFIQMAAPEIRSRQPGMMTLISLAISVSFIYSLATMFVNLGEGFFWELVTLIDIMLLGHWIEMRSVRQASGALSELAKLLPDTAEHIMPDGSIHTMPVSSLKVDNLVLVRPGASVPADGVVEEGESDVNESLITGESQPVKKNPGSKVIGGTININGSLRVRVTATGDQTALAGIMRLVKEAQQSKSQTQILADKAAGWLFYLAIGVAALTAILWTLSIGFDLFTLQRVVAVLVIACPHALGLAVPLVVAISTTSAAQNGILVRNRLALETAREINVIIFDKTGTLTMGKQGVVAIKAANDGDETHALARAAALEADSEHIIARAIHTAAVDKKLELPKVSGFEALNGRGVRGTVDGKEAWIGGPRMLESLDVKLDPVMAKFTADAGAKGQTVVYLLDENNVSAAIALADVIRPESYEAIKRLHQMNVEVAML